MNIKRMYDVFNTHGNNDTYIKRQMMGEGEREREREGERGLKEIKREEDENCDILSGRKVK